MRLRTVSARVTAVGVALLTLTGATTVAASTGPTGPAGPAGSVPGAAPDGRGASSPNVVLVVMDDMRYDDVRWMPTVRRRIERTGTTFTNAYAPTPLCCPSRASMLRGQYPHNTGVLTNAEPAGGFAGFDDRDGSTLATWLTPSYRTGFVGKYLNGYEQAHQTYVPPGWDDWKASVRTYDYLGMRLTDNGERILDASGVNSTTALGRYAQDFVRESAGPAEPFFLFLAFVTPHGGTPHGDGDGGVRSPYVPPRDRGTYTGPSHPRTPAYDEANVTDKSGPISDQPPLTEQDKEAIAVRIAQRREALASADRAIKRMVDTLRQTREWNDTVLIFISDNGLMLGEQRVPGKKSLPYEPAAHLPLLMTGPGIPAGTRRSGAVGTQDLAPTILDIADVRPGGRGIRLDGQSVLPSRKHPDAGRNRAILLEQANLPIDPENDGRVRRAAPRPVARNDWTYRGLVTRKWKLISWDRMGTYELYDLVRDPAEVTNVYRAPGYRHQSRELRHELRRMWLCRGAECDR